MTFVYIATPGADLFKVGISINPKARAETLYMEVIETFECPDEATARTVERTAHVALKKHHLRKELFQAPLDVVRKAVVDAVESPVWATLKREPQGPYVVPVRGKVHRFNSIPNAVRFCVEGDDLFIPPEDVTGELRAVCEARGINLHPKTWTLAALAGRFDVSVATITRTLKDR